MEKCASNSGRAFDTVPMRISKRILHTATLTVATTTQSKLRSYHNNDNQETLVHNITSTIPAMGYGIQVGQYASKERTYTSQDVEQFATVVQDWNPLHTALHRDLLILQDEDGEGKSSLLSWWDIHHKNGILQFQEDSCKHREGTHPTMTKPIVHGMLVSSIFSSIFATLSPGCIYMNQSLDFVRPVYVGDTVIGRIEIDKIRKWRKGGVVIQCTTNVTTPTSWEEEEEEDNTEDSKNLSSSSSHVSKNNVVVKGVANVWLPSGKIL
jgi:acyl dehydratase